jgi:hypothetical protein
MLWESFSLSPSHLPKKEPAKIGYCKCNNTKGLWLLKTMGSGMCELTLGHIAEWLNKQKQNSFIFLCVSLKQWNSLKYSCNLPSTWKLSLRGALLMNCRTVEHFYLLLRHIGVHWTARVEYLAFSSLISWISHPDNFLGGRFQFSTVF